MHRRCCRSVHYTTSCNTQSSAPEDGQNNCRKQVGLTGTINKPLLLHLAGCLYYLYQLCTVKYISFCLLCNISVQSYLTFFLRQKNPTRASTVSLLKFQDHTHRHTTLARIPLDKGSARRRDLYLATYDNHKRQKSIPPAGFENFNPSNRVAAYLRLKLRSQRNQRSYLLMLL